MRSRQIEVSPGAGLADVAELLEDVGLEELGIPVVRLREHHVIEDLRGPAVVAGLDGRPCFLHDRVGTTHALHVLVRRVDGRERVKVCGVRVEPTEVALVHGLRVVTQRAVVAADVEAVVEPRRNRQRLRDFERGLAVVGAPHGLVVDPAVGVALFGHELACRVVAEARPVMTHEHNVRLRREQLDRLVEVLAPRERVTDLRTARRIDVVQRCAAVFGHTEQAPVRQEDVHLRGRFGVGRVLEPQAHTVDGQFFAGGGDLSGRRDQATRTEQRDGLAETAVHVALHVAREEPAIHVAGTAQHGRTGGDVLTDRGLEEPDGGDHLHAPGLNVGVGDDPTHTAEMVDVTVGVDHRDDGPRCEVSVEEFEREGCGLGCGERVDDDPAGITRDERDVAEVHAPNLVHTVGDFEETVDRVELRLAPQTRVHRWRRVTVDERPVVGIPDRVTPRRVDHRTGKWCDATPGRVGEITVGVGKHRCNGRVDVRRGRARRLAIRRLHASPRCDRR